MHNRQRKTQLCLQAQVGYILVVGVLDTTLHNKKQAFKRTL